MSKLVGNGGFTSVPFGVNIFGNLPLCEETEKETVIVDAEQKEPEKQEFVYKPPAGREINRRNKDHRGGF